MEQAPLCSRITSKVGKLCAPARLAAPMLMTSRFLPVAPIQTQELLDPVGQNRQISSCFTKVHVIV